MNAQTLAGQTLAGQTLAGKTLAGQTLAGQTLDRQTLTGQTLAGQTLDGQTLDRQTLDGQTLDGANLIEANLIGANLSGADLSGVIYNENTAFFALCCPEEGSFIGFKKAGGKIVKLQIPHTAKRSSATSRKCRCSKAKVISITNLDGSDSGVKKVASDRNESFIYEVGKTVSVDNFDDNRWNECSTGIHFFITRDEAVRYN